MSFQRVFNLALPCQLQVPLIKKMSEVAFQIMEVALLFFL